MADNPVSPSAGTPTKPPPEQIEEYITKVEAQTATEAHAKMSAQIPPVMQPEFLAKYPPPPAIAYPPVDAEDVRQAESKRGTPAPNEPPSYVDAQGNPVDPKTLPPEAPPATPQS
jgi:hypothetical protein